MMFFTGVFIDTDGSARIIIVEKVLKTAKRLYIVSDIRKMSAGTSQSAIENELGEIYHNKLFLCKKKVFSQDKRPPKITQTPPVLVIAHETNTAEKLAEIRNNKLPVEGIIFQDTEKWYKKDLTPLRYGNNYHVNINDINDAIVSAISTNRITIAENLKLSEKLKTEFESVLKQDHSKSDILKALCLPVWFCERVKQVKRY